MKVLLSQTIASTNLDRQGERIGVEHLHYAAQKWAGRRVPMHQQHRSDLPSPGYFENLRLLPDEANPNEWRLVADIYYDETMVVDPVGGFSIAFLEPIRRAESSELFQVFVPFPHYRDEQFLGELFEEGYVSVGRYGKKSAELEYAALVVTVLVAVLAPMWDKAWKETIGPTVSEFFQRKFPLLRARGMHAELLQTIDYEGNHVEVTFIPQRGSEERCFGVEKTYPAMLQVHDYLVALDVNHVTAAKVFMVFDASLDQFKMLRVHFIDGTVEHMG